MSIRLPVIMVHAATVTSRAERLAESLVGELIGRPGIDLILVDSIERLSPDSTDRLTLDSIGGDVAVMAWMEAGVTIRCLAELGFDGRRNRHAGDAFEADLDGDPEYRTASTRKIFGFDLRAYTDAAEIAAQLQTIRQSLGVKTFAIGSSRIGSPLIGSPRPTDPVEVAPSYKATSSAAKPKSSSTSLDLDGLLDELDRSDP